MKTRLVVSLLALATAGFAAPAASTSAPAQASAAPAPSVSAPSEASIKELLEVSHARSLIDSVNTQVEAMVRASMAQAEKEYPANPEATKILNGMVEKINGLLGQELSWSTMEPLYVRIYQQSFTQQEVDGLVAFYKTPVGEALVRKMPRVMQLAMVDVQQRVRDFMPKAQAISRETMAELKTLDAKKAEATKAAAAPAMPAAPEPAKK